MLRKILLAGAAAGLVSSAAFADDPFGGAPIQFGIPGGASGGGGGGGVTSLAGTVNQVDVSGATGAVTISLDPVIIAPGSIAAGGAGGLGYVELQSQSAAPAAAPANGLRLYSNSLGLLGVQTATTANRVFFNFGSITGLKTLAFQNASGTIALLASQTFTDATVTGSFTATGLVTNADLVNVSTTVNGQACTLGSTCTITAVASAVTVGTTTIGSGADTRVLFDNAGTLGEYVVSGTGSICMTTNCAMTTPNLGTPSAGVLTNATSIPAGQLTGSIADARLSANVPLLNAANTFTAGQTITQGTANASVITTSGYSATSTNTTPMVRLNGTSNGSGVIDFFSIHMTNTAVNSNDTLFALYGGTTGNTLEFYVDPIGATHANSDFSVPNGNGIYWSTRLVELSPADAVLSLQNHAETQGVNIAVPCVLASPCLQLGSLDVDTSPTAQTLRTQGALAGGTSNVAGVNFTIIVSPGKGTGAGGSFIVQTAPAGSTGTVVGTPTTALTIDSTQKASFTGQIVVANMTQTAAAQSGTVCWAAASLTYDATLGCLASLPELKDFHGQISSVWNNIDKIKPYWFSWKRGTPEWKGGDRAIQPGFNAREIAAIPDIGEWLTAKGPDGKLRGVRYMEMVAYLQAEIIALKNANESLHAANDNDHRDISMLKANFAQLERRLYTRQARH